MEIATIQKNFGDIVVPEWVPEAQILHSGPVVQGSKPTKEFTEQKITLLPKPGSPIETMYQNQCYNRHEFEEEKVLIDVKDERNRVEVTNTFPNSIHVYLEMIYDDSNYQGSGIMIGPRHVLTCGHNVYNPEVKKWADKIFVSPGANENKAPFGRYSALKVFTLQDWAIGKKEADLALIILEKDIGTYTGWASFSAFEDAEFEDTLFYVTGYPGDKSQRGLWQMKGGISDTNSSVLAYKISTYFGQSGSGVWRKGAFPTVIGIHVRGTKTHNEATRLSKNYFEWIKKCMETVNITPPVEKISPVHSPNAKPGKGYFQPKETIIPFPTAPQDQDFIHPYAKSYGNLFHSGWMTGRNQNPPFDDNQQSIWPSFDQNKGKQLQQQQRPKRGIIILDDQVSSNGSEQDSSSDDNEPIYNVSQRKRNVKKEAPQMKQKAISHKISPTKVVLSRKDLKAKIIANSEASKFDEMVKNIDLLMYNYGELELDERKLFVVAYKGLLNTKRDLWTALGKKEDAKTDAQKKKLRDEIKGICNGVFKVIEEKENIFIDTTSNDAELFFIKLEADYYRYMAECLTGEELKVAVSRGTEAFEEAWDLAEKNFYPSDVHRLGVALSYSVFLMHAKNHPNKAKKLVRKTLKLTRECLDPEDEDYQEAKSIVEILTENYKSWTEETN